MQFASLNLVSYCYTPEYNSRAAKKKDNSEFINSITLVKLAELRCLNPVNSLVVKVTMLLTLFSECQSETVFVVSEFKERGASPAWDGSSCSDILL